MSELPEGMGLPDSPGADQAEAAPEEMTIAGDPLYAHALGLLQQGHWDGAAEALAELEGRYRDSGELQRARQLLALHLSVEKGWAGEAERRPRIELKVTPVRILIAANLLLYVFVVGLFLLESCSRTVH